MYGAAQKTYHQDHRNSLSAVFELLPFACGSKHSKGNLAGAACHRYPHNGCCYYLAHYPAPERFGTMVRKERSGQ